MKRGSNQMSNEKGIKELKEVIVGGFSLTSIFIRHLKDGFDPTDPIKIFLAIQSDPAFKDAIDGINKVPSEIADVDLKEGFELGVLMLNEGKKLVLGILGK
jgi:hypothetical protein